MALKNHRTELNLYSLVYRKFGSKVAIVDGVTGRDYTFNEVDESTSKFSSALNRIPFCLEFGFCGFSSNSPARMRHSVQIDTPLSSRARALWRSCCFTDLRTASVPAFQPAQIYDMSHPIRTVLLFVASKRRPTTSEDAWVVMPPAYRVRVHKCASFLDVSGSV